MWKFATAGAAPLSPVQFLFAALIALAFVTPATAAPPTCKEFKARLSKAEKALGIAVPVPEYQDLGTLDDRRDWKLTIKGIEGELSCRKDDDGFSSLQLTVIGDDKYIDARFHNLVFASLWAYTQWPRAKAYRAMTSMLANAKRDLRNSRVRGENGASGTGAIDLEADVSASIYGGEALRLGMMIDASAAK